MEDMRTRLAGYAQRLKLAAQRIEEAIALLGGDGGSAEAPAPALAVISPMEKRVAEMLCDGHTPKQIARDLNLDPHTVYQHRLNLREKLKVADTRDIPSAYKALIGSHPPPSSTPSVDAEKS